MTDYYEGLHRAVWQGRLAEAESIIRDGHSVNCRDAEGQTPLFLCVSDGYLPMIRLLVESGANTNARDGQGRSPLHQAAVSPASNRAEVAAYLLANGADSNARDANGDPVLYVAALKRDSALVDVLLNAGANPDLRSGDGRTVLHVAAANGDVAIALTLIGHQADVNAVWKRDGSTPLVWALFRRQEELAELLIARGAEIIDPDPEPGVPRFVPENLRRYAKDIADRRQRKS